MHKNRYFAFQNHYPSFMFNPFKTIGYVIKNEWFNVFKNYGSPSQIHTFKRDWKPVGSQAKKKKMLKESKITYIHVSCEFKYYYWYIISNNSQNITKTKKFTFLSWKNGNRYKRFSDWIVRSYRYYHRRLSLAPFKYMKSYCIIYRVKRNNAFNSQKWHLSINA